MKTIKTFHVIIVTETTEIFEVETDTAMEAKSRVSYNPQWAKLVSRDTKTIREEAKEATQADE